MIDQKLAIIVHRMALAAWAEHAKGNCISWSIDSQKKKHMASKLDKAA